MTVTGGITGDHLALCLMRRGLFMFNRLTCTQKPWRTCVHTAGSCSSQSDRGHARIGSQFTGLQ
jgi:hypothetical protein